MPAAESARPLHRSPLIALALIAGTCVPLSATLAQAKPGTPPGAIAAAAPAADSQVPIRRITLYRSGVGYFERSGNVDGNAQLQMRFKTEQINDILKSMVLLDLDGGRIDSVSYASKEPLTKRLASFGINIADNPATSDILQRLRGTAVKIFTPDGEHSGTIMNVEKRPTVFHGTGQAQPGGASVFELPWINLLTDKGVRSFDLTTVSGFEILDKELADELNKALSTLAEYRADTSKTVDLRFAGNGARRVVVGYVQESPVWKTSYRLVLPESDPPRSEGSKPAKPSVVMQGWAIVENTTDQDWNGVQLALVSGRPVSFQMDLYEPLFTFRPTVPVPTIPGVMPRTYGAGIDLAFADKLEERAAGAKVVELSATPMAPAAAPSSRGAYRKEAERRDAGGVAFDRYTGATAEQMVNYAAQSQAQAGEVGEVFQYEVQTPVSIERQRSAMIPIISANVTGRRVSIYNASDASDHPMRGVELVNEADLQLLPGPIAVFDGAAYAGDAQIGHIGKGEQRLLSYSLDLDVNVLTKPQSDSRVTRVKIVDGMLVRSISTTSGTTYAFDNKDPKRARTVIVESPRMEGWDLVEPKKALEETKGLYRFEVGVDAGKTGTFTVSQRQTSSESVAISSIDMPTILAYHKDGKLSPAVLKAIEDVAKKQSEINTVEREIAELDRQKTEIDAEQGRIRENMTRIDRASQLYTRYMTKLTDQENTLETLRDQRKAAGTRLESLRAALNEFLRTLNVE